MSTRKKIEVEIGDLTVTATQRSDRYNSREWGKNTRVYGAIDELVPELLAIEPHRDKSIPITIERERFETDEAYDAMVAAKREYNVWFRKTTKEGGKRLLPLLGEFIGRSAVDGDYLNLTAKFSRKAGCSCPCSPGFVLSQRLVLDGKPVDIWVENTEERKAKLAQRAAYEAKKAAEEQQAKLDEARALLNAAGYGVIKQS